ncbi:hypothetical protein, conserved [Eimeria praecox]|uniref:Uncharacterized protein n=1 Tax=Eimeria praecox TaxID=51316 RepID=U6H6L5_9EIME|nr:hypothetical protein, conserved [Eimeria praecox]
MAYARGNYDLSALMSQQRLLRQQEQQVKAEVLRLSRVMPFALPQDRPLPPPPPQNPIERRANRAVPCYSGQDGEGRIIFEGGPGCLRNSRRDLERREDGEAGGMAAAVARRRNELQQQQRERQEQILQQHRNSRRHFSCGGPMEGVPQNDHEDSPYTFPFSQEGFQGLSRLPRSATASMTWGEGEQGMSRAERRQQKRISPCSLPAAGMPSGGRRQGEDLCPTRQRRQVLPDYAAANSSPLLHASDAWPLQTAPQDASRQLGSNPLPCSYAGGFQGSTGFCMPSTLPPALHSEPGNAGWLNPRPSPPDQIAKDVLPAGLPSQHCNGSSMSFGPPRVVWDGMQAHLTEQQRERQQAQYAEQQGATPSRKHQADFTAEVAAGKPSSQLGCDAWGFRRSLRASDEVKTSVGRQAAHTRTLAASNPMNATPHFDVAGAARADDEETLRQLGVSFSPRELLFFKKQANARAAQQRSVSRRSRSCKPSRTERGATELPLERGGCEGHAHMGNVEDPVLSALQPEVWTLPAWMRAYGVSGSPTPHARRVGGQRRVTPSRRPAAEQARQPQMWPADSPGDHLVGAWDDDAFGLPCGCRCCRLRRAPAPESGLDPADRPCCCCPCCNEWRLEAGHPPVDSNTLHGEGEIADQGDAKSAGAKGKCYRCGKWSTMAPNGHHPAREGTVSMEADSHLSLEQAASLCAACAAYLACEREREKQAAAQPWGPGVAVSGWEANPKLGDHMQESNHSALAVQESVRRASNQFAQDRDAPKASTAKSKQEEPGTATAATGKSSSLMRGEATSQKCKSIAAEKSSDQNDTLSAARQLCTSSKGPPESNSVWKNPRITSKICQYLSLSKLLIVRRCNKTLLQAAQYRMRFILYNSLFVLMHGEPGASTAQLMKMEGQHCPLSADALIKLLGLEQNEVEEVKAGNLPPACPPEAATPRMQDVSAGILRSLAELKASKEVKPSLKPKAAKGQPILRKKQMRPAEPPPPVKKDILPAASTRNSVSMPEEQQKRLLDAHMAKQQAQEEAYLKMLQDQIDRPVNFGYDEAAGPVASPCGLPLEHNITGSPEPATFRRVRHAFLKLWNYDDEAFRQALVRATTTSYPSWLFDVAALLLRAVFQLCCNSLSAPPLKDLIPLFSPKRRPPTKVEVPCRSDSYLWAKMARISGYAMHLVSDQAWPPLRDPVIRLVAQPFISPDVMIKGSGVDAQALYDIAAGGAGVTPLVLRPSVVDSLEIKMSKVSPEFITEFLSYGRQQQLIHSPEQQRSFHGGFRQFKASSELILMMDLYEWLAAVLTHMQNTEVSSIIKANSSTAGVLQHKGTKGTIPRAGMGTAQASSPAKMRAASRLPRGSKPVRSSSPAVEDRSRACSGKLQRGAIGPTDARVLRDLIEEQSVILREVCNLLKAIKTQGLRSSG